MKLVRFSFPSSSQSSVYSTFSGFLSEDMQDVYGLNESYLDEGLCVPNGDSFSINDVRLEAPIIPRQVIGVAYNYKDLVGYQSKYNDPLIFLKSCDSIVGPFQNLSIDSTRQTWSEVELVVVIGKACKYVSPAQAPTVIFGYTIGNDVTSENTHGRDHHLALSKALPSYGPIGPYIDTCFNPLSNIKLINKVDGRTTQDGTLGSMILDTFEVVSHVSQYFNLMPGDVIFTGTPANAMTSLIRPGSLCELSIDGLGTLVNTVL